MARTKVSGSIGAAKPPSRRWVPAWAASFATAFPGRARRVFRALATRDARILALSTILALLPWAAIPAALHFQSQPWSWNIIWWRHELVFAGFVALFVTLVQIGSYIGRRSVRAFLPLYLMTFAAAAICACILTFYNHRRAIEAITGIDRASESDFIYVAAATMSPGITAAAIGLAFLILVRKQWTSSPKKHVEFTYDTSIAPKGKPKR